MVRPRSILSSPTSPGPAHYKHFKALSAIRSAYHPIGAGKHFAFLDEAATGCVTNVSIGPANPLYVSAHPA